eukprot:CAMPEP_0170059558 /NCGR_PEP_ID=MMETSP0019_2-20121128/1794_1 /TAXON_ID=98059 /ORGANISM="Dinobryon sp., Strain UTEXLB2267" /LENGTH=84 /DNA_ID=CAMNT_0010264845 /DNA_START=87 /DNA_END=341 /DNA_ORIENTATION=+
MSDPLPVLEGGNDEELKVKGALAAGCMTASIRSLSPHMRCYKGLRDGNSVDALLDYLDHIVISASDKSNSDNLPVQGVEPHPLS